MPAMQVVELCRSCRHERASHRQEDGRCTESIEALVDEVGVAVAILCDCPGWPGRRWRTGPRADRGPKRTPADSGAR